MDARNGISVRLALNLSSDIVVLPILQASFTRPLVLVVTALMLD